MEVRNQKGEPYKGGSLYGICTGIQRFIRENRTKACRQAEALDIYKDPKFALFRRTSDGVLKDLR